MLKYEMIYLSKAVKGTLSAQRDENDDGANNCNNPCWCIFKRPVQFFFCHVLFLSILFGRGMC